MQILTLPFKLLMMLGMIATGENRSLPKSHELYALVAQAHVTQGVCMDKALKLTDLLREKGYTDIKFVTGKYHPFNKDDHAWVEWNGWILDPTFYTKKEWIWKTGVWKKRGWYRNER